MSVWTASLINPIYSSALFAQGTPSSRTIIVVMISLHNFLISFDVCSPSMLHMITSVSPISLPNCWTAFSTSISGFIVTTYTYPFYATNIWQHVLLQYYLPSLLVKNIVSTKKYSLIRLYRRIRSLVPMFLNRVGLSVHLIFGEVTSRVR